MEEQDHELVARAREGDNRAFRELVERHGSSLFRVAARVTGNRESAEDVVQETFLKAHRQLDKFDNRAQFGTWIYRIAMNRAIDHVRKEKRRSSLAPANAATAFDSLASSGPTADRLLHSAEIATAVRSTLSSLSPRERAAFVLRHYQGCSIAEIAEILGLRPNACKSTIFRAVRKLREALQPLVGETP